MDTELKNNAPQNSNNQSNNYQEERSVDRLARYIIYTVIATVICSICWYFKSIIIYILLAAVVSLIGKPIKKLLSKFKIKGKGLPQWLLSIITIFLIIGFFLIFVTQIIPIVGRIAQDVSISNIGNSMSSHPIANIDRFLIDKFPGLGENFSSTALIGGQLKKMFSVKSITSVIGSVASVLGTIGAGLFSVIFISFFFIKDEKLFSKIIASLVPTKHEEDAVTTIHDIEHLLSRYFVGLLVEICVVALINFLGLSLIAKLSFSAAIGIAVLTGILNIIPYVGPLTGTVLGTILGLVLKYSSSSAAFTDINFLAFTIILISIFMFTQLIDNILYQPFVYSSSIKASPLEIFIVLLMAGTLGGIVGMLVAIPGYTVLRVAAIKFFGDVKAIKRLASATANDVKEPKDFKSPNKTD